MIVAIAFVNVPVYARLMRARFLVIRESQYALAAAGVGAPPWRVLTWHLLPNASPRSSSSRPCSSAGRCSTPPA